MKRLLLPTIFVALIPMCGQEVRADAIRVGDETFTDVYVLEQPGEYVILFPWSGETQRVSSKRTDVQLMQTSDEAGRKRLHEEWSRRHDMLEAMRQEDSASDTTGDGIVQPGDRAPVKITNETIIQSNALEETARFETELMLWAQLDAVVREELFNAAAARARSDVLFNMGRVRAMQEVRNRNEEVIQQDISQLQDVVEEASAAVTERQAAAANELARAQSMAGWAYLRGGVRNQVLVQETRPLVGQVDNTLISPGRLALGNIYWGNTASNQPDPSVAAGAAIESATRAEALSDDAAAIAGSAEEAVAQTRERVSQLESQNQQIATEQTALALQTEDALARAQRELAQMQRLEDAFLGGYELTIPFTTVRELDTTMAEEASLDVEITAPLWRVMWGVSGPATQSSGFVVSVRDAEGKPVGGNMEAVSPYGRYMVLDGPGQFTIRVAGARGSHVVVVVEEATEIPAMERPRPEPPANPAESPARAGS
jgi:hypothetical protein